MTHCDKCLSVALDVTLIAFRKCLTEQKKSLECNGRLNRLAISMAVQLLGSLPFEVKVGHLHLMCSAMACASHLVSR